MTDYSQNGEQAAILEACKGDGRFLDIGAWHATQFSNTRALYERGWGGVLIEPSPGPMLGLLGSYGRDERITLIQSAVSAHGGLVTMQITDDAVSTSDSGVYDTWKNTASYRGAMMVPSLTWRDIATQFGGFQFVNIDAEGASSQLFLAMLSQGIFPSAVCVEHDGRTTELLSAATPHNYKAVLVNGGNMVVTR